MAQAMATETGSRPRWREFLPCLPKPAHAWTRRGGAVYIGTGHKATPAEMRGMHEELNPSAVVGMN